MHDVYPLIELSARDPNGARREFLLGGRADSREQIPNNEKVPRWRAYAFGSSAEFGDHLSEFVEACRKQAHVEVDLGGWWNEPDIGWDQARSMPGDSQDEGGSAYRSAALQHQVAEWSWAYEEKKWVSKVPFLASLSDLVLRLYGRSYYGYHPASQSIVTPDELVVTEDFVYVRVGKKSFRTNRSGFRMQYEVLSFDRARVLCTHFLFGQRGRLVLWGGGDTSLSGLDLEKFSELLGRPTLDAASILDICQLP